jgi:hypothetical protein
LCCKIAYIPAWSQEGPEEQKMGDDGEKVIAYIVDGSSSDEIQTHGLDYSSGKGSGVIFFDHEDAQQFLQKVSKSNKDFDFREGLGWIIHRKWEDIEFTATPTPSLSP